MSGFEHSGKGRHARPVTTIGVFSDIRRWTCHAVTLVSVVVGSAGLAVVGTGAPVAAAGSTAVTSCTTAGLDAALAAGGPITFGCDGSIVLDHNVMVGSGVTLSLDATGHAVTLRWVGTVPMFDVEGGSLTLVNLTVNASRTPPIVAPLSGADGPNGTFGTAGTPPVGLTGDGGPGGPGGAGGSGGNAPNAAATQGGAIHIGSGSAVVTNTTLTATLYGAGAGNGGNGGYGGGGGGGGLSLQPGWVGRPGAGGSAGAAGAGGNGGVGGAVQGGAIWNAGTLTVTGSTFINDLATGGSGGSGGNGGNGGGVGCGGVQYGPYNGALGLHPVVGFVPCTSPTPGGAGGAGGTGGAAQGGAIWNSGALSVTGSTFTGDGAIGGLGNASGGGGAGSGGGIDSGGNGTAGSDGGPGGSSGAGGTAEGGAIYDAGSATLSGLTFSGDGVVGGAGATLGLSSGVGGNGGRGGTAEVVQDGPAALEFQFGNGGNGGNGGAGSAAGDGGGTSGPVYFGSHPPQTSTDTGDVVRPGAAGTPGLGGLGGPGGVASFASCPAGDDCIDGTPGSPGMAGPTGGAGAGGGNPPPPPPTPVTVTKAVATATGLSSGPVAGNTPITITGTGFGSPGDSDLVMLVPSGGGAPIPATGVLVHSSTTITAVTGGATAGLPAGQADLVTDVEVTATGQTSLVNAPGDQFTYQAVTITSITTPSGVEPPTGSPAGGTRLTIGGQGFGSSANDVSVAFCPPGTDAPSVAACPLGTSANGNPDDTGFPPDSDSSVSVIDPPWTAPDGSGEAAVVFVEVFAPGGGSVVTSNPYTFTYDLSIRSIAGGPGSPAGGTTLTIDGQGFGNPDADLEVFFCPPEAASPNINCAEGFQGSPLVHGRNIAPVNDTTISVEDPAWGFGLPPSLTWPASGEVVTVFVRIDIPLVAPFLAGSATSNSLNFTYALNVTSITTPNGLQPATASPAGGQTLTINGQGFGGANNNTVEVYFCQPGTSVPVDALGFKCLTGTSTSGAGGSYPGFAPDNDGTITVVDPTWSAAFGAGAELVFVHVEPCCGLPSTGGYSIPLPFTYGVAITSISPASTAAAGGTTLTIHGHGFGGSSNQVSVQFCGVGCAYGTSTILGSEDFSPDSDTTISVVDPALPVNGSSGPVGVFVTVFPANGGPAVGSSNTYNITYKADAMAPPCGTLSNCNGATSNDPSSPAVATSTTPTGAITATGNGTGGITVGRYPADPVGAPAFNAAGSYFDVSVSNPNSFTSATIQDCDLQGGTSAQWWNPAANAGAGAWQPVTPETLSAGPPPCLTITMDASSSPTLAQLTGTVFGTALPATGTAKADVDLDTSTHDIEPGNTVTLRAGVSGRDHKPKPTGTVSFTDNGIAITACTDLALPTSGRLTCTLSYASTTGSPHHLVASYSGDSTYEPGTASITIRVAKIKTHLRLDASNHRVTAGQQVTYRATISADEDTGSPMQTGTMTFTDDGVDIPGCTSITVKTTGPTICAATATNGIHHIKAVYSGDNAYAGSSATLTETVKPGGAK